MNTWYNADGNLFKLKDDGDAVMMRAYRLATDAEDKVRIIRESYKLNPEFLKLNMKNGKLRMEYYDFYIEPYMTGDMLDEFSAEADREYDEKPECIPSEMNALVCPIRIFE